MTSPDGQSVPHDALPVRLSASGTGNPTVRAKVPGNPGVDPTAPGSETAHSNTGRSGFVKKSKEGLSSGSIHLIGSRIAAETFRLTLKLNAFFVFLYKVAGFALLGVIVIAMVAFLSLTVFYHVSDRWVAPQVLNADHARVQSESIRFLEQKYQLEKLRAELVQVRTGREVAERAFAGKVQLEGTLSAALDEESERRQRMAEQTSNLREKLQGTEARHSDVLEKLRREEERSLAAAERQNLIGRKEALERRNLIDQMDLTRLDRIQKLYALESFLGAGSGAERGTPSVDDVRNKAELLDLELERARLQAEMEHFRATESSLEELVATYADTVERMAHSPFVRARDATVVLAQGPYANMRRARPGAGVWGCYLEFILCQKVGVVKGVLPGETTGLHPVTGRSFRGQFVEIEFQNDRGERVWNTDMQTWAEKRALMLGRPPLFL